MKKFISCGITALLLIVSSNAMAFNSLAPYDQQRISSEVRDMQEVLDLSDKQYKKLVQIKADLTKANNRLIKEYGRNSKAHREGRKPHWAKYQKSVLTVITRDELRRYNASKK